MNIRELHPATLKEHLGDCRLGRILILFDTLNSTMDVCSDLGEADFPEGTVITALHQRKGRGRKGRAWFSSSAGGLVFSVLLRPGGATEGLMTLFSYSIIQAFDSENVKGMMKWPNDIYINGGKAGGILAEGRKDFVVMGAGLNINEKAADLPPEVAEDASSLRMAAGRRFHRGKILCRVMEYFEKNYLAWKNMGLSPFLKGIREKILYINERVSVESGEKKLEGRFAGISDEGYLLLETRNGTETLHSGDLTLRRKE